MAKKGMKGNIGRWAFLIGLIIAIIIAIFGLSTNLLIALVIIGLIVGLLNVTEKEVTPFLMSGTVLIIASFFGKDIMMSVPIASSILDALLVLFVPATIVVAVKNVFNIAKR